MIYIILLILSLVLLYTDKILVKYFSSSFFSKILDNSFNKPQAFHYNPVPRVGGAIFMLNLLIISILDYFYLKSQLYLILFIAIPFFLIGLADDIKIIQNEKIRIIILILMIIFLIFSLKINVNNTGLLSLNYLIKDYFILKYLFLILCFLTVINGSNFIDGFNGLLIIHSAIIFIILIFLNSDPKVYYQMIFILVNLLILLIFNFPRAKLFLGDSGAYVLGLLLSFFAIQTANSNLNISPFFICIILFYIFFEVLFSFCRKILIKKNPMQPDSNHLHMLFYKVLYVRFFNKSKNTSNYITGIVINLIYLVLILPALFFYKNNYLCKIYFFMCIIIYIIGYFYIFFKSEKLKKL